MGQPFSAAVVAKPANGLLLEQRLEEVSPQIHAFLQDIQDKFISSMHQRFNRSVFGNRNR